MFNKKHIQNHVETSATPDQQRLEEFFTERIVLLVDAGKLLCTKVYTRGGATAVQIHLPEEIADQMLLNESVRQRMATRLQQLTENTSFTAQAQDGQEVFTYILVTWTDPH